MVNVAKIRELEEARKMTMWSDIWNVSYSELRIWKSSKPTGSNPGEVLTFSGFCSQLLKLRSKLRWSWLTWFSNPQFNIWNISYITSQYKLGRKGSKHDFIDYIYSKMLLKSEHTVYEDNPKLNCNKTSSAFPAISQF